VAEVGGQPSAIHHPPSAIGHSPSAISGLLKTVFGYDSFRPLQSEIIANILSRCDTLAVMPTGSGKSLCYQLPALLFDGLTVVVSPLISLMQDQVDQLRELGAPAAFLNSTLEYGDYVATTRRVREGEVKLLYTSPETLLRPETLVLLDRARVDCLAIDEAHCISQWGHDFRPEYRQLLPVRQRYGAAVCVAFTATATPRVQADIRGILGFRAENAFIASFNRENLFLQVQARTDGFSQTLAFVTAHRDQSGIIYCGTRRQVDTLTAQLTAHGWSALPYHAGMEDADRRRNQEQFSRDRTPIIVATIAFGMGINKSNVRFVLHYNLPESLENYYQEIGRAGRDGLRGDCLLLFSRADLGTIYQFIEEGAESERAGRHARLQAMTRYAEAEGCRRKLLLEYFGEEQAADACGFCDNCQTARGEVAKEDVTTAAQMFLSCVKATGQKFGAGHVIDVLRGSKAQNVLRWRHDRLQLYSAGAAQTAKRWRYLAEQFIRQGLLEQEMEHGTLRLTRQGEAVLRSGQVFVTPEPRPAVAAEAAAYDEVLFGRLRALRREIAETLNLPPYIIFSDRSLVEMATYFPQSSQSFLAIHGVGERKLAQHGERFLAAIRAYCAERGLAERPKPAETPMLTRASTGEKNRTAEVGELFAAGQSVAELQALYDVKQTTIVEHLSRCVRAGQTFPAGRILPLSRLSTEDQARVLAAIAELGAERLKPLFDALGGAISYDELAVMRLYYLCAAANPVSAAITRL
jgi:ATP-dependent DNA helicase RecQ